MARPQLASDDEILDAAQHVLGERGLDAFSVSEVARRVGLSRTAITLRFKSGDELKRILLERRLEKFESEVRALDIPQGAVGLLAIADMVAAKAGSRGNFSNFMLRYSANVDDPVLSELEERRGAILRNAILSALPDTPIGKPATAEAFMANLTGSLLHWQASDEPDARIYIREKVLNWLRLMGIPIDESPE